MANNPDWAQILKFLKEQNGRYRREITEAEIEAEDYTPPQVAERMLAEDLIDKTGIKDDREYIRQVIADLDNSLNLVELSTGKNAAILSLEPDGFEVAHERELSKRQEKINSALVVFTLVLVIVNLIGYFPSPSREISTLIVLVFLIGVIVWSDIFNLPSI